MKALKTDAVFENATGFLGSAWANMCALENELATKMLEHPIGAVVLQGQDGWILQEDGDELVMCHGNYIDGELIETTSRFDFSLEWVDIGEEDINDYCELLRAAIEAFNVIGMPVQQ